MKIYLAGSTKEIERSKLIGYELAAEGHSVLNAWVNLPQDGTAGSETRIWHTCFRQIRESDALVAVVPNIPSRRLNGAVCEVGYALGRGLPVFLYDVHGVQSGTWLYAPGITIAASWEHLLQELQF